jgi:hypothetical protein
MERAARLTSAMECGETLFVRYASGGNKAGALVRPIRPLSWIRRGTFYKARDERSNMDKSYTVDRTLEIRTQAF